MSARMILLPPALDRLLVDPERFVRERLDGWPGWATLPVPARERFLGLLVARFAVLSFGSPLAAYGLGVLDAFESSELPRAMTRGGRDALIERVERGVLVEMVRCGVIRYPISQRLITAA